MRERLRDAVLHEQVPPAPQTWHGLQVRGLGGTTFRLPPAGNLPDTYGRATGKCGESHWVTAQAVVTFCWATWLVVAHAESPHAPSETTLVRHVLSAEAEPAGPGTRYIADRGVGIYRTVQVAAHSHQHVLLRLDPRDVAPILGTHAPGRRSGPVHRAHGTDRAVRWTYRPHLACETDLPCPSVPGRLLFVQLCRPGFRPRSLYLFTTLRDASVYPLADLVALYADRWQVELRYRDLKTTLNMEYFDVRSAAMFAKELEVGLLAYTLIRLAMLTATGTAVAPDLPAARRLAFAAGRRRVSETWQRCWARLPAPATQLARLCGHLAACRLPVHRRPLPSEPRVVRRRPQPYPALKGPRQAARDAHLAALGAISS